VNSNSFTTFANTISFNISRYPALSEVTDSKNYSQDGAKVKGMDFVREEKSCEQYFRSEVPYFDEEVPYLRP
jgi:hypothetical protein